MLQQRLLDCFRADAGIYALTEAYWLRLSAQAYNELSDYTELADRIIKLAQQD